MTTITFDTHKVITDLEKAGMPTAQAEAMIAAFKDVQAAADLVTKKDLELSSLALRGDIQAWRADIQKELEPIRSDIRMLKWMVSVNIAGTLALIGLAVNVLMKWVK